MDRTRKRTLVATPRPGAVSAATAAVKGPSRAHQNTAPSTAGAKRGLGTRAWLVPLRGASFRPDGLSLRPRTVTGSTAVVALAVTVLIASSPGLHFAYRKPALHVALETAASLIALLGAYLASGRFHRSGRLDELILACCLGILSLSSLAFAVLPAAIERGTYSNFTTWASLGGRLLGSLVFAAAAFASPRRLRSPGRAGAFAVVAAAIALAAIGLVVAFLSADLPTGVEQSLTSANSSRPRLEGDPAVLAGQIVGMLLFFGAAFGFARRAERTGDDLMLWLGVGGALAAVSRLNYALYPSLYSDYVYTGDAFTLLFYLVILGGSAREIGRHSRSTAELVALEERRRIARDLHDSLAQELAYITRNLTLLDQADETVRRLARSAERAWHESRRTIFALSRPLDVPLVRVLTEEAEAVAAREGARVTLSLAPAADAWPEQREVLIRVACEAIRNAVRHGGASLVHVELARKNDKLLLRVRDEGTGFDPSQTPSPDAFGLSSMAERAAAVGGELRIHTAFRTGTEVELTL